MVGVRPGAVDAVEEAAHKVARAQAVQVVHPCGARPVALVLPCPLRAVRAAGQGPRNADQGLGDRRKVFRVKSF